MDKTKLDSQDVSKFMNSFYGYGTYSAPYWFIGMEEGGGNTISEVQARLDAWTDLGSTDLLDLADFHYRIDHPEYFEEPVKAQSTWNKLIRLYLAAKGHSPDLEMVKEYQSRDLGRANGDTCLMELFPLPSQGKHIWRYSEFTDMEQLVNRETYEASIVDYRIKHIQEAIKKHKPHAVIFYGITYRHWWERITENDYNSVLISGKNTLSSNNGVTRFVIAPHPTSHGVTNEYYQSIGCILKDY